MPGAGRADVARGSGRRRPSGFRWRHRLEAGPAQRGKFPRTPVESQPPGRDCVPRQPKGGRGACHRAGPVADMGGRKRPARVRAGTRAKSISRGLSGSRPEQSGRKALKRGGWISQPSRHAGRRLSDAGQHPASSGPRALSATHDAGPLPVAASPTPIPEALPACGPPDHPPVARKCPHLSDNRTGAVKSLSHPGGDVRAGAFSAA
jgi:hypothetical protein